MSTHPYQADEMRLGEWRPRPPTPEELRDHASRHSCPGPERVSFWLTLADDELRLYRYRADEPFPAAWLAACSRRLAAWRPLDAERVACEWPAAEEEAKR